MPAPDSREHVQLDEVAEGQQPPALVGKFDQRPPRVGRLADLDAVLPVAPAIRPSPVDHPAVLRRDDRQVAEFLLRIVQLPLRDLELALLLPDHGLLGLSQNRRAKTLVPASFPQMVLSPAQH